MLRLSTRPSVITRADRARDAKQWDVAARHYRKALSRNPWRGPIWIQYGHALKELGKLAEAESAYRRALTCEPDAKPEGLAEPYLQLGHVLKLRGKADEAKTAFLRALMHDHSLTDPLRELPHLGWSENALAELVHGTSVCQAETRARSTSHTSLAESVLLAASRLFDAEYYREQNPDVDFSKFDPLTHYFSSGYKESRPFHPLFDVGYYENTPNTLTRSENPLLDFVTTPIDERVIPLPFLDVKHYYAMQDDIGQRSICPYEHFLMHGRYEPHCSPNLLFSHEYIWHRHPSVQFSNISAVDYYLTTRHASHLRFLFVGHEASRTGAPLILLRIVEYFASWSNVDCFVILDRGGPLVDEYRKFAHVTVVDGDLRASSIERNRADTVSYVLNRTGGGITAAICNTLETLLIGKELARCDIPVIILAHEMPQFYSPKLLNDISWARKVILPATFLREQFRDIAPSLDCKISIMPQGLLSWNFGRIGRTRSRDAVLEELGLPDDAVIVLGCGTSDTRKGVDWFASVGRITQNELPANNPLYFIWVGGANHESRLAWTQMEVTKWDLETRIRLIGERADVEKYFVAADIFLLSSRMDPFPCVVHEAMAAHLAVIAFEGAGGAPEALADGAGVVVPFGDTEGMARSVIELAADHERRRQLGAAAARRVAERYSFIKYAAGLIELVGDELGLDKQHYGEHRLLPAERTRPRIIFSAGDWEISGANSATDYLAHRLTALGYDTTILFSRGRFGNLDEKRMPSTHYEFLQPHDGSPRAIWQSLQVYLKESAPCVFVPNYDYLASAVSAVLPPSVAIVGIAWADDVEHYEHCYRLGLYWNQIVAVSQGIKNSLAAFNPALASKTTVIHPGVPISPSRERDTEPVTPARPLRLVYTGRLVQRQKRIFDYVALARRLDQSGIPFHLTLAGKSPNDEFDRVASELAALIKKGVVELPGKLDPKDVQVLLNKSDVFLLLSDFEGLSVSLLEAMERGCIPIVYDMKSGVSEVLDHGRNGYVVQSKNLDSVVEHVARIAAVASLRQSLSKAARDTIINSGWSDEAMAKRWQAVFSQALAEVSSGTYIRPEPLSYMSPIGGILPPPIMFRGD